MDMPWVISVKIGMQPLQNLVNAFHMSGVARRSKQQQYRPVASFKNLVGPLIIDFQLSFCSLFYICKIWRGGGLATALQ